MATIGLSKPYFAPYSYTGAGNPTYSGGFSIGKAVELSLELEGGESNNLYADNSIAESDNQFAGGTVTLTTDDLLPVPMMGILGLKMQPITLDGGTTQNPQWIVFDDDQAAPYGGLGGIVKKQINNVQKWVAIVFTKTQFSNPGLEAVTQGETIEWQTTELTATIMRDDSAKHTWRMQSTPMDTEADAEAAVKQMLNIKDPTLGTLTVNSAAGTEEGDTAITVTPTLTYGNHYVYKTDTSVTLPTEYGEDVSEGWQSWNGTAEIAATTGNEIGIVESDTNNKAVAAGKTTVTANGG